MFVPPIAKPKLASPQRSAVTAQRPSQAAVTQAQLLQRTFGNQAMLRLLAQRASVTRNKPGVHENEDNSAHMTGREAAPSWDFSNIPVPLFPASCLPGPIQPKLQVGAVDDPLEHQADSVAEHVMRMPAPNVSAAPLQVTRKCACEEAAERQEPRAAAQPLLQRKCACGEEGSSPTGECDECDEPTPFLQTKLTIGAPDDVYEQEADRVAERVTRAPETGIALAPAPPQISRNFAACEPKAQDAQRKSTSGRDRSGEAPALVHEVLGSPGRALDTSSRAYFEPRFGRDFGHVLIHDDARAAASARPVNALAYTLGQHIVFGAGIYGPRSDAGRRLLAHELTHVVQQGAAPAAATPAPAEAAGERATEAGDLRTSRVSKPGRLQREPMGGKDTPKTEACPPMERDEREEAAKAQLRLVERIPPTGVADLWVPDRRQRDLRG